MNLYTIVREEQKESINTQFKNKWNRLSECTLAGNKFVVKNFDQRINTSVDSRPTSKNIT